MTPVGGEPGAGNLTAVEVAIAKALARAIVREIRAARAVAQEEVTKDPRS